MHAHLIERGEIIDSLIKVKRTQESGAAFRPAREAEMMRRTGRAPPWDSSPRHGREHLARHHRDLHVCAGALRGARRFRRGRCAGTRTPPAFISASRCRSRRISAPRAVVAAVAASKGDLGLVPASNLAGAGAVVDGARGSDGAQDHCAAAVRRARGPSGFISLVRRFAADRAGRGDQGRRDVERPCRGLECCGRARFDSPWPKFSQSRTASSMAPRCSLSLTPGHALRRSRRRHWSRPALRCAPRPSSAGTRPAIRSSHLFPICCARKRTMSASERPVPKASVLEIAAYVPGRSEAPGAAKVYKLSSNETPLGPSPKAIEAFRAASETLHYYPDGAHTALREAIARTFGLDPLRIVCGERLGRAFKLDRAGVPRHRATRRSSRSTASSSIATRRSPRVESPSWRRRGITRPTWMRFSRR